MLLESNQKRESDDNLPLSLDLTYKVSDLSNRNNLQSKIAIYYQNKGNLDKSKDIIYLMIDDFTKSETIMHLAYK